MSRMILTQSMTREGTLILVNREHPLRSAHGVELTGVGGQVQLERRAAMALEGCIRSVCGQNEIVPVSGWRSAQEQKNIWNDTLSKEGSAFTEQYVARPGCSEHQTGLAIDLGKAAEFIDFIRPDFPKDGVCGAFRRQAARWGFIQRYRAGKQNLTGIAEEPWHFRYVGAPHAAILEENELCLEEYTAFLKQNPVEVKLSGCMRARVSYIPCKGERTEWDAPDGYVQISGDNCGGFIATVWRWA